MRYIKKFNEDQKVNFHDLILLFAELSDDDLTVTRTQFGQNETSSVSRNIAIEVGEYFRSNPYLLKDIVNPSDEGHKENAEKVLNYLERNKPFVIDIQVDTHNKVDDTLKILNFIKNNSDQMRYFGYEMDDFFIREAQPIGGSVASLFNIKYKPL